MKHEIIHGDCLQTLKTLPDNSVDSIVTDPPAGIGFMGKEWDKDKGGRDNWIAWMQEIAVECLRVLKHGGHAFVWSLPRTSHWTAMAWENAGFEPRDRVAHVFGSGFPKSHDIGKAVDKYLGNEREVVGQKGLHSYKSKDNGNSLNSGLRCDFDKINILTKGSTEWEGWGTALKPAVEDWWLFRKPIAEKTVAQNVLKYGTGALNIDACRVGTDTIKQHGRKAKEGTGYGTHWHNDLEKGKSWQGRFPANIILDDSEEVRECFPETSVDENSNASRFFKRIAYFAKASRSERNKGCEDLEAKANRTNAPRLSEQDKNATLKNNHHPTVKPVALMQYLIQMITPKGGTVLDAFAGSGTTGVAAKSLGFGFIGLEREGEYVAIARARITAVTPNAPDLFTDNE